MLFLTAFVAKKGKGGHYMINNYSLLHIEANQCKAVLEQVLSSKPVFSQKNQKFCDIVQTVLYGMCDKIKNESLTYTEVSTGIIMSLMRNINSAYEGMFELNEMHLKEYHNSRSIEPNYTALSECKSLLKEVIKNLNHVIQITEGSGEADIFWVSEGCPECGNENTFVWNVETMGYKVHCPSCGAEMMLCDACSHSEDNLNFNCNNCDWEQGEDGTGTCFRCRCKS